MDDEKDDKDDFDICRNYHGGNAQSETANRRTKKAKDNKRIEIFYKINGPATCEEMELALDMRHQTASARCSEAKKNGWLRETGKTRLTRTDSPAAILEWVPEADRELQNGKNLDPEKSMAEVELSVGLEEDSNWKE